MEISELLTGTFRLEDCESDTNGSYSGSLVATDNGDSTYLVTLADVLSGVSDTATLTLSGNELIGSFDLGDGMIEVKTVRGCTLAGARDNSESDTDMAGREQPIPTGSVSEKQTEREKRDGVELQTSIETKKPTITKALRAKLDKRLGAIDESERETIYRMLIEKLDTAIAKTTNTTKQQTYSEVREYIQSRLESEFSQSSEGDGKILDSIFSESSHQDD
ncbi:MAG TPA: hypothetical protein PK765_00125 [bacterium]|nr:hypothetical protein [bacterium]